MISAISENADLTHTLTKMSSKAARLHRAAKMRLNNFTTKLASLPQPGSVQLTVGTTGIARLTLCNASRRNSLTGPMMAQLLQQVEALERSDASTWAVVLSGEGGHFCSGADLGLALEHVKTHADGLLMSELMTSILQRFRALPLLSVAAIDGNAIGGGAELCTAADWRVVAENGAVQFVQTRMGASTGWGGAARLAEVVGSRAAALRILLHQPKLDADAAHACGLADAVGDSGESAADAAERLLLGPAREKAASAEAIRAVKSAVSAATPVTDGAVAAETHAFGRTWGGPANREALARAAEAIAGKKR